MILNYLKKFFNNLNNEKNKMIKLDFLNSFKMKNLNILNK